MFQINWKLKALLYKVFGFFNLKHTFYLIQKYVTKRSEVNIAVLSIHWKRHGKTIEKFNCKNILEIGAGKSLEQNIFLSYNFNNKVKQTTIDINPMLDFQLFNQASKQISILMNKEFKGFVRNYDDLTNIYNIEYFAPHSMDKLIEADTKFDLCISTTTLEHFSIDDLKDFLKKINLILKEKQLISSIIDYSDHYAHTDNKITYLNYLKFSSKDWKKYNNKYLFQNRLRHQNYRELFVKNNFKILEEDKGKMLEKIEGISNEFDEKNEETFLSWGYYLISAKTN